MGLLVVAVPQTTSAELTPDPDTLSAPTNGLGVRSLLSALVACGPDAGVVLLLPAVVNLLQHARGHLLRHQHVHVGVLLPLAAVGLLDPNLVVGVVVLVIVAGLLRQPELPPLPLPSLVAPHLAPELLRPVLRLVRQPRRLSPLK